MKRRRTSEHENSQELCLRLPAHEPGAKQPTPDPSQEGKWPAGVAPLLGGAGGGFRSALRAKSSEWSLPATKNVFSVAQIVNLLCRRLPIGRALAESRRSGQGAVLQDDILRYSRL